MKKRKRVKDKGKTVLTKIFQEFKIGDRVSLVRNLSFPGFPKQFHGQTGTIIGKSGRAYIVQFLNGKVYKQLVLKPVHLQKLKG